jgi:phospholipid transport system substrate-binding protein
VGVKAFARQGESMKKLHNKAVTIPALVLATIIGISASTACLAATANPSQVVTSFHDTLLGVMKEAKTLGVKGRYDKLKPSIEQSFHLPLMIQVAASSYWQQASPDQVDRLVGAFTRMSVSTYASQFDGYSGEKFETKNEQPGPQNTTLVKTQIVKTSGSIVDLIYVMRQVSGNWRIVDVLVDKGISELAVKRSEYRGVLREGGVDALIRTLNAKADLLLTEKPK